MNAENDSSAIAPCANCGAPLTGGARFCAQCGQPVRVARPAGATGDAEPQFNWMARENMLADISPADRARYERVVGQSFGCLVTPLFVFVGLIAIVPTVPLLALFGLPLAVLLFVLVAADVAGMGARVARVRWFGKLPGVASHTRLVAAGATAGYIALASILCILIMRLTQH